MTLLRLARTWLAIILLSLAPTVRTRAQTQAPPPPTQPDQATTAPPSQTQPDQAPAAPLTEAPDDTPKPPAKPVFNWRPLNYQNALILHAGNYATALPYVENGLKSCPDAADAREAALCEAIFSENRAEIREHMGDPAGAEADLGVLIKRRADVLPPLDRLNAESHEYRARFYERQKRWADAEADWLAAEKILRTQGPASRALAAGLETRRANLLKNQLDRGSDALPLYQDAYAIYRDAQGPAARDTLIAANNLLESLKTLSFWDDATKLGQDLLASDQVDHYDPDERAKLAGALANAADTDNRRRAVRPYAEAALAVYQKLPTAKPDILFTLLNNLSQLDTQIGDAQAGAPLALQALTLAVTTWGPQAQRSVTAMRTDANAETALGHYDDALMQLTTVATTLKTQGNAVAAAQVEVQRGQILSNAGRDAEAIKSHQTMVEQMMDSNATRAEKAATLSLIGADLARLSPTAALWPCEQAAQLGEGTPNLAYTFVVQALTCEGKGLIAMDQADQALPLAERARQILAAPANHQANVQAPLDWQYEVLIMQAQALRALKRYDDELVVEQEKLAVDQKLGPDYIAPGWVDVAIAQREAGHYPEAEQAVVQGLAALGDSGSVETRISLWRQRAYTAAATNDMQGAARAYETVLTITRSGSDQLAIGVAEKDLGGALTAVNQLPDGTRHLSQAVAIFRTLGPSRAAYLRTALDMRITAATRQHDLASQEADLREILPLYDADSVQAAVAHLMLANVLDVTIRHDQADSQRAEAVAIMAGRYGPDTPETMRTRLNALVWLRGTGRFTEARKIGQDCVTLSQTLDVLRVACLTAAAETALQEGADRTAAGYDDQAIAFIEDHWQQYNNYLRDTLLQRARAAAGMGDANGVIRFYDRIHDLTRHDGTAEGWIDETFILLLFQAGEPGNAEPVEQRVSELAQQSNDTNLIVAITNLRADRLIDTGAADQVQGLWAPIVPLLGTDPSANRLTVLESQGRADAALAQLEAAAGQFQQAADMARILYGAGSPTYGVKLAEQATALSQLGHAETAEAAIAPLTTDSAPAATLLHMQTEMAIAMDAGDMVAALHEAKDALATARAAAGSDSPGVIDARLTLGEVQLVAHQGVNETDLEEAMASLVTEQPGWQSQVRVARLQGLLAMNQNRLKEADDAFTTVEKLLTAHQGPQAISIARAQANRAELRLAAGDAAGADALFKQALALAAPHGAWQNAVWAQIAANAATAAERTGDPERAAQLRHDAAGLLPEITAHAVDRWL